MIPLRDVIPSRSTPVVTTAIIAVNVIVFLFQLSLGEAEGNALIRTYGLVPAYFAWPNVIMSMFLHGGLMHVGGNMLYLWIFGNNVEDAMGHGRYVCFYFACGIIAALAQALSEPGSLIPMVGASGAISGVLASYAVIFPRARVNVVIPIGIIFYPLKISAVYVISFWFLLQLPNLLFGSEAMGGTAWWAHVGGFLTGLALTPLFSRFPLFGRHKRQL